MEINAIWITCVQPHCVLNVLRVIFANLKIVAKRFNRIAQIIIFVTEKIVINNAMMFISPFKFLRRKSSREEKGNLDTNSLTQKILNQISRLRFQIFLRTQRFLRMKNQGKRKKKTIKLFWLDKAKLLFISPSKFKKLKRLVKMIRKLFGYCMVWKNRNIFSH